MSQLTELLCDIWVLIEGSHVWCPGANVAPPWSLNININSLITFSPSKEDNDEFHSLYENQMNRSISDGLRTHQQDVALWIKFSFSFFSKGSNESSLADVLDYCTQKHFSVFQQSLLRRGCVRFMNFSDIKGRRERVKGGDRLKRLQAKKSWNPLEHIWDERFDEWKTLCLGTRASTWPNDTNFQLVDFISWIINFGLHQNSTEARRRYFPISEMQTTRQTKIIICSPSSLLCLIVRNVKWNRREI